MDIVSWSFDNETYDQDKPLYIDCNDPARFLSARETRKLVRQLVSGFNHYGLVDGDCVCAVSFNDINYTSVYLGIIGAGGCFTGANPGYTAHELTHHVRITKAKFLLTSIKTLDITLAAANACGIPHSRIFVLDYQNESIPGGHQSWKRLLSCGEKDWVQVEDPDNTPAAYVSTSGTSGLPKAAIIPHSYLVSQAGFQMETAAVRYKISSLVAIPPFHVFTLPVQHAFPLRKGAPAYIMPRFEGKAFVNAVEKFRIAHTVVVPPILMALAKCEDGAKLRSLRRIYVGGSCATDGMQQQLYTKLSPQARIEQVYGMTEVGWATTWHDPKQESTGSVGRPLPGTTLRVVDRDGALITEEGVSGEIHIHCAHPMKGYLGNPTATAEAFTDDGWVRTGDVGYLRDGKWYVIDRTKDLIKVRGWQVSPAEIEAVLLEHSSVVDAAVIGVAARDGCGEVPMAFVVRKVHTLVEKDIKDFIGEKLARYKGIEEVKFVDRIPRNPTGKILRRVLRDTRGTMPATDPAAASAYSNAIKDLEKYQQIQQERNPDRGSAIFSSTSSIGGPSTYASRPAHSRTASLSTVSLTDASTIDPQSPRTPPPIDEMSTSSKASRKRKGEFFSPSPVKRRSQRIAFAREKSY